MKINRQTFKRSTIIHIIVWMIIFSLPYIFGAPDAKKDPEHNGFRAFITCTTIVWMGLFYLNALVLIPRVLFRKKYIIYLLLLIVCYCTAVIIFSFLFNIFVPKNPYHLLSQAAWNVPSFLFTMLVSTTYKTIYDRFRADAIADEKQKENLKTELSFLRSQISPHFLFNVLNNIVSLVRLKSEELEPTVLKLSSLMQYMLYDTDEEKVLLIDEAQYLQSYIDLQQQRFGSKVKITASLDVNDSTHAIEPMLLIPFVENAFKHGVGLIDKPEINIKLYTEEDVLYFLARNKYTDATATKDKTSGIGLANVQRRLELLYGKDYNLAIKKDNSLYTVSLQIKLKP
jgi:two-component system LytT family sensor kinase